MRHIAARVVTVPVVPARKPLGVNEQELYKRDCHIAIAAFLFTQPMQLAITKSPSPVTAQASAQLRARLRNAATPPHPAVRHAPASWPLGPAVTLTPANTDAHTHTRGPPSLGSVSSLSPEHLSGPLSGVSGPEILHSSGELAGTFGAGPLALGGGANRGHGHARRAVVHAHACMHERQRRTFTASCHASCMRSGNVLRNGGRPCRAVQHVWRWCALGHSIFMLISLVRRCCA